MSLLKSLAIRGLSTAAGGLAGTVLGPEASPIAYMATQNLLSSDLASKGIKALVNHQFHFGDKKLSARDIIRKVKGLPENIISHLPSQYQGVAGDIAKNISGDIAKIAMSKNPLQEAKDIASGISLQNTLGYAKKIGVHDLIEKVPQSLLSKVPQGLKGVAGHALGDISRVLTSDNPLQAGKDLYKEAKNVSMYANKLGIHDALGKIGKDLWKPASARFIESMA